MARHSFARHASHRRLLCPFVLAVAVSTSGCHHGSPTEPEQPANTGMTGTWLGSADRGPCTDPDGGDLRSLTATLTQSGDAVTGEIVNAAGVRHSVTGTFGGGLLLLSLGELPGTSTCYMFALYSTVLAHDLRGNLTRVSGQLEGRCCGTVAGTFRLDRRGSA